MGGKFITDKSGLVTFSLSEFNLKKQISWVFHVDDLSESSSTYGMTIGQDFLGELDILLHCHMGYRHYTNTSNSGKQALTFY
jgi:hypothetical protein